MAGKRRLQGEGTFYKDEKRCQFVWKGYYQTPEGVQKRMVFKSKDRNKLQTKIKMWQERVKQGLTSDGNILLEAWIDKWLKSVKQSFKITTYTQYECLLRLYVKPRFGKRKINTLKVNEIQTFLTSLYNNKNNKGVSGKELSAKTVNHIRVALEACLTAAVDDCLIPFNPVRKTKKVKDVAGTAKVMIALDEEQLQKLVDVAKAGNYMPRKHCKKGTSIDIGQDFIKDNFAVAVELFIWTGMRLGELFGLHWSDVVLSKAPYIRVETNLTLKRIISTPKTDRSFRIVALDTDTAKTLKTWKLEQKKYAGRLGNLYDNSGGLVFTNSVGKAVEVNNFRRRQWSAIVAKAGLPKTFGIHQLRHSHVTWLLSQPGMSATVVAQRTGDSLQTIMKVYAHLLPGIQSVAVEAIEKKRRT